MKKPRPPRSSRPSRTEGRQVATRPVSDTDDPDIERMLAGLPEDAAVEARLAIAQSESFRGPLPPPALYEHYNEVLPGSADRIMTMAEKEQDHRIWWEQSELKAAAGQAIGGQILGFLALLALIGGAIYTAAIGATEVALAFLGTAILGVVARFVTNRWSTDGKQSK